MNQSLGQLSVTEEAFYRSQADAPSTGRWVNADMHHVMLTRLLITLDAERELTKKLKGELLVAAHRISAQAELLSKRAEKLPEVVENGIASTT